MYSYLQCTPLQHAFRNLQEFEGLTQEEDHTVQQFFHMALLSDITWLHPDLDPMLYTTGICA